MENDKKQKKCVGILSMHRVINFGSFWQAYLLKKLIEDNDCNVDFIDIQRGRQLFNSKKRLPRIKICHHFYTRFIYNPHRKELFNQLQLNLLGCSKTPNYSSYYDCIIIGSDEVFNFAQLTSWGFSSQLHGAIDNDNVNSYAASFGASTYDDAIEYGVKDELIRASSNLKHISVRDENSVVIMKQLLPNTKIERHLDPVLVGDLPIPKRNEVEKKYIIVYAYDYRFNDKAYINAIRKYAHKNKLKIYSVGFYQTWVDKNILCDPFELLQYFVNAEYIVTDTFHGTIFSVRCHKQFVTVFRDGVEGNRQKLTSLLKDLHLESRQLNRAEDFEWQLTASIDYQLVDEILLTERKRTDKYLKKCLLSQSEGVT